VAAVTSAAEVVDVLRAALGGEVIGPEDAGFDLQRKTFNAMVDARPVAIAHCASREDVVNALAAGSGFPIAIRGGGTSDASTVDGGIVIDLSALDAIEIDVESRTARVGGGVTWGELDAATQEHGLAVTGARLSALGVVGVALGEGSGWLERALGPTSSSVVGTEAVESDGLRVVTRLDLRLHPVGPELLCGFLSFPRERAPEVARAYRDHMERASDQVGGGLLLGAGLGGVCTIVFCYLGTVEPEAFNLDLSFRILFMVVIGGLGTVLGSFLGAAFVTLMPVFLSVTVRFLDSVLGLRIAESTISNLELMVFGALIIFFLIVEPHGLARLWQIGKEKLRLWPFPH